MKKIRIWMVISLLFFLTACNFAPNTTTNVTTQTTNESDVVWLNISTKEELMSMDLTKNYQLVNDIDLGIEEWIPLGNQSVPFSGMFNGKGYTISNLRITLSHGGFVGLFGVVVGKVYDLKITNVFIDVVHEGILYVGGLAGYVSNDVIDVFVSGSIVAQNHHSNTFAGLLAGFVTAKISSSMSATQFIPNILENIQVQGSLTVHGKNFIYAGGLVGKLYNTELKNIDVSAMITIVHQQYRAYVGGVVGHNYSGILQGFESVITDPDIKQMGLRADVRMNVSSQGTRVSVGGLMGYNNYGVISQSAVNAIFTLSAQEIISGGIIGEDWQGTLQSLVVKVEYIIDPLSLHASKTLSLGGVSGYSNETTTLDLVYYTTSGSPLQNNVGTLLEDVSLLTNAMFYSSDLNWEEPIYILPSIDLFD
jgi:hypothetical protein